MDTTTQDQNTAPSLSLGNASPVPGASLAQPNNPMPVPVAGQTDKQNTASPLGLRAPSKVHIKFDDGTEGDVPQHRISDAIKDGGKITTRMFFDDGTEGWIPLNRVHDAIKDGGRLGYKPSTDDGQGISQAETGTLAANAAVGLMGINPNPLTAGMAKGTAETAHTLGAVAGKVLPNSLRDGLGLPASFQQPAYLESANAGESVGKAGEGIAEFVMGDEALKGLSLAERMGIGTKLAKVAEAHPAIAKIIDAGLNVFRTGTVSGAQSGLHDPSAGSIERGAAFGAGGQLVGEAAGAGAAKLFPRTGEAAEQSAAKNLSEVASQRQGAAKTISSMAGEAADNATSKSGSTATDFKTAADQIKQNYSPTFDKLREATGGTRNNLGRYGVNGFDDANSQIKRAKQVLYSPSPSSTDALKQAEKELTEGEAKLRTIFDSTPNVSKADLAQAKQAWANANTLEDLHGYVDQSFSEPAGIRNIRGSKPSEIDPAKFVQRANKVVDEIGADKLKAALGANTFSNFLEVRQGLSKLVGEANYDKALDKAARTYLKEQGASLNKAAGGSVAGASTAYFSHLLGASNPLTAGVGATVGLIHFMYTNPAAGVKILRLAQKSAPYAAQGAKQVVTHVFNPESGEVEEQF